MGCWRVQDQIEAEALARQATRHSRNSSRWCSADSPHAPVRIGEALHQDVRRIHTDADLPAFVLIPGADFGIPHPAHGHANRH